jgi:resuscitation-promoting factor RpfA
VSQPEISPLARRLAEENNVDWRDLHGSGAGGKVVERDVLEYLARVMAGEEDIDPTPEPVPEGMEAWPEDDVQAFQHEIRASHQNVGLQEIQQELSASDRLSHGPAEPSLEGGVVPPVDEVPSTPASPAADAISEDIFLFDDDEDETVSADEIGWRTSAAPPSEEVEDGLLVEGDDSAIWDAGDEDLGGGDELWATESEERPEPLPDVFGAADGAEQPERVTGPALFDEGVGGEADASAPVEDGASELEMPPLGDLGVDGDAGVASAETMEHRWPVEADEPVVEDEAFAAEGWDVEEPGGRTDDLAGGFEPPREITEAGDGAAFEANEESAEAPVEAWAEPRSDVPGSDVPEREAEVEPRATESDVPASAPEPPPATPPLSERVAAASDAASSVPGELPLVTYGTLLRRHVDVTALAGAQLAVGLELGDSEPLSPAPFLLRAAAKAVADGGWGDGRVAMVGWDEAGSLRVSEVGDAAGVAFVELARALSSTAYGAAADAPGAALAVADMSALDVDEAVLNVKAPLLTLGRILYDNQRGSYRSTLSLAGDVPPERGAQLLARVAELLDAPVRLLV